MTNNDLFEYQIGQMYGCGGGAYGHMGNMDNDRRRREESEQRDAQQRASRAAAARRQNAAYADSSGGGSAGVVVAAGPREPGAGEVFATEWTDAICTWIAGGFAWAPAWAGRTIRIAVAVVFFALAVNSGGGMVLAALAAGVGWFTPRITLAVLRGGLYTVLALVYIAWWLCVAGAMLAAVAGAIYLAFRLLAVLA